MSISPFSDAELASLRATTALLRPTEISVYYASNDVVVLQARLREPREGGPEGEVVRTLNQRLVVFVAADADLRFGGEFEYQGAAWEIKTVPVLESYGMEKQAMAEYIGKADA